MGKRKRGKRKQPAITKRDPDAKKARRSDRAPGSAGHPHPEEEDDAPEEDDEDAAAGAAPPERDDEDASAEADDEPDASDAVAAKSAAPAEREGHAGLPDGADWAAPLVKLEARWTWFETRLMFVSLIALTLVLCLWIGIRGMREPLNATIPAGTLWRALVGAAALGGASRFFTRNRMPEGRRNLVTCVAVVVGLLLAPTWRGVGIDYFEALNDWLQEGSSITLFHGLKGISTRLTMLVALLGGSLAAASGSHINIDVVIRLLPRALRKPVALTSGVATAVVCFCASWGFLDHIAITSFEAKLDATPGEKISAVTEDLGEQFFVWRKQVGLDVGAIPYVIQGKRWNDETRWTGGDWNTFLDEEGFVERYGAEEVAKIRAPENALAEPWQPFVVVPGDTTRGMLQDGMDLLWPVGFFMMGLRFLLRALLLLAGHIRIRIEGELESEGQNA